MLVVKNNIGNISFIYFSEKLCNFNYHYSDVFLSVQQISSIDDNIHLDEVEIDYKDNIRNEKRLLYYVKSRKMAKKFISQSLSIPVSEIKIYGGVKRPPYSMINDKRIHLSISHRDDYIACSFSKEFVITGVDIEKFENISISNLSDFLDDLELIDEKYAIICWSVKESFLKMVGKGMTIPSKSILVSNNLYVDDMVHSLIKDNNIQRVEVLVFRYFDYVVSLSLGFRRI